MKTKILIRLDDICPTMDWKQFYRVKQLLDKYNIKPLIGVIPQNQDNDQIIDTEKEDYWKYLINLQKEGYSIAMHGFTHVYDKEKPLTIAFGWKHSEFAGNTYENQSEKIRKGKEILNSHGIYTDIFFAPAHTYDTTTLRALHDNGFHYISDGKSKRPYIQRNIICIPCRCTSVPVINNNGLYTSVSHPSEWRRKDKESDYYLLEKLCKEHTKEIVTFQEMAEEKTEFIVWAKINEKSYILFSFIKRAFRFLIRKLMKG